MVLSHCWQKMLTVAWSVTNYTRIEVLNCSEKKIVVLWLLCPKPGDEIEDYNSSSITYFQEELRQETTTWVLHLLSWKSKVNVSRIPALWLLWFPWVSCKLWEIYPLLPVLENKNYDVRLFLVSKDDYSLNTSSLNSRFSETLLHRPWRALHSWVTTTVLSPNI